MFATPLSWRRICCVRSAIVALSRSAGRPPRHDYCSAATACRQGRPRAPATPHARCCCRLLGRERAARRLRVEPELLGPRLRRAEASAHESAHIRRAARNLAISSTKSLWALKKNEIRWPTVLTSRPASDGCLHVRTGVRQRERHFLDRGRAGFTDVIPADGNRIPLRHLARAERQEVGHDAQR